MISPEVMIREWLAWRATALAFAALLIAGSASAAVIMVRDAQRIGELDQRLSCWEAGRQPAVYR